MQSTAGLAIPANWPSIRRFAVLVLVIFAEGCAVFAPIPRDQEVDLRFVWSQPPGERISIRNMTIRRDAGVGGAGGALVGAGAAGLACGPWAPLCMPFTALAGMLVGGAAGAGVGVLESWDQERVELLHTRLNNYLETRSAADQMKHALSMRTQATWKLGSGPNSAQVQVEIREFSFHTFRAGEGALFVRAWVKSEVPNPGKFWTGLNTEHEVYGPAVNAKFWLECSEEELDRQFDLVYRRLADGVLSKLTGPGPVVVF